MKPEKRKQQRKTKRLHANRYKSLKKQSAGRKAALRSFEKSFQSFLLEKKAEILEGLNHSPNGKGYIHIHLPDLSEIEIELDLNTLSNIEKQRGVEKCNTP